MVKEYLLAIAKSYHAGGTAIEEYVQQLDLMNVDWIHDINDPDLLVQTTMEMAKAKADEVFCSEIEGESSVVQ